MSSSKNNRTADSSSVIGTRTSRKKTCFCCPQTKEQTPKKIGCKVTRKTGKKTDNSVSQEIRSKNNIQTNYMPRKLVNLGTNILDTSIVLRNDNYAAHDNKKINKYSRLSEPKIITSYQYSKDQYFKMEILKGNRKQMEGFEEVTNVEENNKRFMINLSMAQSQVLHNGGCLLIKKGIFPVDVKLTKINNPTSQELSKKNYNREIIINNVINVKKYSRPSFNSESKLKINSSTERITNSTELPEQSNQIVNNFLTLRSGNLVNNQSDSTIQKEQVFTNVNGSPIKLHHNSKKKMKNSSPTTVNNEIAQSTVLKGPLKTNVNNNIQFKRLNRSNPIKNEILPTPNESILKVGSSNPIKNEILPIPNTSISKAFDRSLINKMKNKNIEENEKITEDINTEEDSILLVEDDPIESNTPRRWLQEIKTITKITTIIKTREIPTELMK